MYNTEVQKTVIRMRAEGKSIRSIADELEISPTTVCQWNKEFTADIRESHKQELEDVLDGMHASKVQRTRALVKAFKKIELYIQNKEFTAADLRVYSLFMRLDRYIAQDIMHDVPPLPPKHICPDPIINVTTDMPIPPPRSKPAQVGDANASDAATTDPVIDSIAASSTEHADAAQSDSPEIAPDGTEQESIRETTTFMAGGNRHRNPVTERTRTPAPAASPGVAGPVHQKSLGSPTRDTINIHVDRNRNVTVSKIPKGTSLKR